MSSPTSNADWCVIIPAFREAAHIADVVRGVRAQQLRALVVDDGSDDDTALEAERAGAEVIRQPVNRGKGAALQVGFEAALARGACWIVTMDADGQHAPSDLPAFLAAANSGAPALIGNRMSDVRAMPWVRRITNRAMSALLSRIIGQRVPDTQCGYRAYRTDILPLLATTSSHFEAESEVLVKISQAGHRIESVPIQTLYGKVESKINPFADTIRFFAMLHRLRQSRRRASR